MLSCSVAQRSSPLVHKSHIHLQSYIFFHAQVDEFYQRNNIKFLSTQQPGARIPDSEWVLPHKVPVRYVVTSMWRLFWLRIHHWKWFAEMYAWKRGILSEPVRLQNDFSVCNRICHVFVESQPQRNNKIDRYFWRSRDTQCVFPLTQCLLSLSLLYLWPLKVTVVSSQCSLFFYLSPIFVFLSKIPLCMHIYSMVYFSFIVGHVT